MVWTQRYTEICERAEASGLAYDKYTGLPLNIDTLDELASEYDTVRNIMSVDDFMEKRIIAVPIEEEK